MTAPTHAQRLLALRKMDPSPANLAYAERRVFATGRLSELGGHLVPGVVSCRTIETGDADAMSPGSMTAEVTLHARTQAEWNAAAAKLLELENRASLEGIRLIVAVRRATRWDRIAAWLAWTAAR